MLPPLSMAAAARTTLKKAWGKEHSVLAYPVGAQDSPNISSQVWPWWCDFHQVTKPFWLLLSLINKMVLVICTPFFSESHSIHVGGGRLVEF